MMTIMLSRVALQVLFMTYRGAASDGRVAIMTTLNFQCCTVNDYSWFSASPKYNPMAWMRNTYTYHVSYNPFS